MLTYFRLLSGFKRAYESTPPDERPQVRYVLPGDEDSVTIITRAVLHSAPISSIGSVCSGEALLRLLRMSEWNSMGAWQVALELVGRQRQGQHTSLFFFTWMVKYHKYQDIVLKPKKSILSRKDVIRYLCQKKRSIKWGATCKRLALWKRIR